jgi:hypothetical protein
MLTHCVCNLINPGLHWQVLLTSIVLLSLHVIGVTSQMLDDVLLVNPDLQTHLPVALEYS